MSPWALSLSIRYDDNSDFDDITTWRATTSYQFGDTGTRLRATAGTGQKRPTFVERFGFFTNFTGNPNLKPEKSKGWDLGIDQALMGGRVNASVTYFSEDLQDEINGFAFDPVSGGFTAVNRPDDSERRGFEAELGATLSPAVEISASYTYTDSRQPDGFGGLTREIRRPRAHGCGQPQLPADAGSRQSESEPVLYGRPG